MSRFTHFPRFPRLLVPVPSHITRGGMAMSVSDYMQMNETSCQSQNG